MSAIPAEPGASPSHATRPPGPDVVAGRDGWLFLTGGPDAPLALYAADPSFGADGARAWKALLTERTGRLAGRGTAYVHLVVPDKLTIMRDAFDDPARLAGPGPLQRLASLPGGPPLALLDISPHLRRRREHRPMYWRTGSTWTPWASHAACETLCLRLGVACNPGLLGYRHESVERSLELAAGLDPAPREAVCRYRFAWRSRRRHANALVERRDATGRDAAGRDDHGRLDEGSHVVFENRWPGAVPRSVLLFGDACSGVGTHLLAGMLAETFREVHVVWSEGLDDALVRRVRPDIVVSQGVERRMTVLPDDAVDVRTLAAASLAALDAPDAPDALDAVRGPADGTRAGRAAPDVAPDVAPGTAPDAAPPVRHLLLGAETYRLEPPLTVQPECVPDLQDPVMTTAEVSLTEVPAADVYFNGDTWSVAQRGGAPVFESAPGAGAARGARWAPRRRLAGTTLLLGSSAGAHLYYHWMLEILPRLGLLARHGIDPATLDHVLVREIAGDWQIETLARLGVDRSAIVETRRRPWLRCERLLHVDLTCGINLKMPRFVPLWASRLYPVDATGQERLKLYLARPEGKRRGISNEAELAPVLEAAGVEKVVIEGRSVREQAMLMARADVVVAPHGGALTNLVFCRPGTRVVELLSRHVYPYYYGLAASCGLVYHAILENPGEDYPRLVSHRIAQSFAGDEHQRATAGRSFRVAPETLERTLRELDSRPPPAVRSAAGP